MLYFVNVVGVVLEKRFPTSHDLMQDTPNSPNITFISRGRLLVKILWGQVVDSVGVALGLAVCYCCADAGGAEIVNFYLAVAFEINFTRSKVLVGAFFLVGLFEAAHELVE